MKSGTGTLTFAGSNTYTGGTDVNAGLLVVNGLLASAVTVNSGGILGGTGNLTQRHGRRRRAASPGLFAGRLESQRQLGLGSGAVMDYELDTPSASDLVLMPGGQLILSGQQFGDFKFTPSANVVPGSYALIVAGSVSGVLGTSTSGTVNGYPATLAVQGTDLVLNVHATPEPSTFVLLAVGTLGIAGYGLRTRLAARKTARPPACEQQNAPPMPASLPRGHGASDQQIRPRDAARRNGSRAGNLDALCGRSPVGGLRRLPAENKMDKCERLCSFRMTRILHSPPRTITIKA